MKFFRLNLVALIAALVLVLLIGVSPAAAQTFNVQYFEVPTGTPESRR